VLEQPVARLRGMREDAVPDLERKGVRTIGDLVWYLPRGYRDFSQIRPIADLVPGQEQTAEGVLTAIHHVPGGRGRARTEADLVDRTGRAR
jgi:ATP-dependent DNA helicase RecG